MSKEQLQELIVSIANEYEGGGMSLDELVAAHRHSYRNRVEMEQSIRCGCFCCGSIFDATEVEDYIDDGETALCPYCDVDSVVGDASGIELNPIVLNELNKMYF